MPLIAIAPFIAELPPEARPLLGFDPCADLTILITSPNWPTIVTRVTYIALDLETRSLGQLFPRLIDFADDEIPSPVLDSATRSILQRAGIRTWEELASWTACELASIHNMSEASIASLIKMCVEQLAIALESHRNADSSHLERQGIRHSAHGEEAQALSRVSELLQLLAAWAIRERDVTKIGEFLQLVPDMTADKGRLHQEWVALADESISRIADTELLRAEIDNLVASLFGELTPTELAVYQARLRPSAKRTLGQVGQLLGLTGERVRQIQIKAEAKINALARERRFLPLLWRASDLGGTLALAAPLDSEVTSEALSRALRGCKDEDGQLTDLLLRLAGPYKLQNGWYLKVGQLLPNWIELKAFADDNGILELQQAHAWFRQHGFNPAFFDDWLTAFADIRRIDGSLAIWSGSVVDKCATLLAIRGTPTDADTLVSDVGEGHSVRSTRQRLFDDPRFMRVSKNEWALRSWAFEEYTGIADEIAQRVKEQGGQARLSELMDEIPNLFKVSRASVRAYAEAPMFILEDGWVRLRRTDEPFSEASDQLSQVRGLFKSPDGHLNILIPVDREVLRGSGRQCPPALALALRVGPGASRTFIFAHSHHVAVTWSVTGLSPALGSIRPLAEAVHCTEGDLLRVTFNQPDSTVDAFHVPSSSDRGSHLERLRLLTGLSDLGADPAAAIADAIGVPSSSLRVTLRERGDEEVLSLLPGPPDNAALDAALSDLARLLHESG
jgi:hypothetical protein